MRVRIFQSAKSAMQSARPATFWRVEMLSLLPRRIDPLRGGVSADDPYASLCGKLTFATQGEALTFVRRRGWDFVLDTPNERRVVPKSYLDNFKPDSELDGR